MSSPAVVEGAPDIFLTHRAFEAVVSDVSGVVLDATKCEV
jgi:hypothetical protein